jgi:hypothetical protein
VPGIVALKTVGENMGTRTGTCARHLLCSSSHILNVCAVFSGLCLNFFLISIVEE